MDKPGSSSLQRSDDSDDVIVHRFKVYDTETEPLLDFYRQRGLLVDIDGEQPVESVFADITAAIDTLGCRSTSGSPDEKTPKRGDELAPAVLCALTLEPDAQVTGGGTPSTLSVKEGSQLHTRQAWRMADRPKSMAASRGSGTPRTSSQSSTYSWRSGFQRAVGGARVAVSKPAGAGSEREEGGVWVASVTGPPAHLDLLGVAGVAHDELARRRVDGKPREEADGKVERAPPGVDRRRSPPVGGAECRQHQRGLARGGEVRLDLGGVVGGVLVVLVEWCGPGRLLRMHVDPHRADQVVDGGEDVARHLSHGPIRCQRDAANASVAVFGHRLVAVQVQRDDEGP